MEEKVQRGLLENEAKKMAYQGRREVWKLTGDKSHVRTNYLHFLTSRKISGGETKRQEKSGLSSKRRGIHSTGINTQVGGKFLQGWWPRWKQMTFQCEKRRGEHRKGKKSRLESFEKKTTSRTHDPD